MMGLLGSIVESEQRLVTLCYFVPDKLYSFFFFIFQLVNIILDI